MQWTARILSNPMALIAEGSATVRINGYLAAHLGDKLVCGGKFGQVEKT